MPYFTGSSLNATGDDSCEFECDSLSDAVSKNVGSVCDCHPCALLTPGEGESEQRCRVLTFPLLFRLLWVPLLVIPLSLRRFRFFPLLLRCVRVGLRYLRRRYLSPCLRLSCVRTLIALWVSCRFCLWVRCRLLRIIRILPVCVLFASFVRLRIIRVLILLFVLSVRLTLAVRLRVRLIRMSPFPVVLLRV